MESSPRVRDRPQPVAGVQWEVYDSDSSAVGVAASRNPPGKRSVATGETRVEC